jgi:hypothetical protein
MVMVIPSCDRRNNLLNPLIRDMTRLRQPNCFYPTYSVSRCLIAVVLLLLITPLKAKTAAVSKPFVLRVEKMVRTDNQELALTFEAVTRDNGCPKDVRCIVAGSARC